MMAHAIALAAWPFVKAPQAPLKGAKLLRQRQAARWATHPRTLSLPTLPHPPTHARGPMLKQALSLKLLQKLSPQQIQFIKLLQVPTAVLDQRVKEELEENPALEEGDLLEPLTEYEADNDPDDREGPAETTPDDPYESDSEADFDVSDYLFDDEVPDYKLAANNNSPDDEDNNRTLPVAVGRTFYDALEDQLGQLQLNARQEAIAHQIVGSIDEDGYLRRPVMSIADDLAFSQNLTVDDAEVEAVLRLVQAFDPAGVGAKDLRECLLLQLARKPQKPAVRLAQAIIEKHFEAYGSKHFEKIARSLSATVEDLREADAEIHKLNPRPGGSMPDAGRNQTIIPDFEVMNQDGELELKLNSRNAPDLRVSSGYRDMLKEYSAGAKTDKKLKETVAFVKQKLDSAKWFIDAVKQRQNTLLTTMDAIVRRQRDFFLTGDETRLRPMILKDIAEEVGLDISTISRVASSKYVQTEWGTFNLKHFFSEGIMTDTGEEASSKEVKRILSDAITAEDKANPLSDEKLMEILNAKGYNIARRTVAKYREAMDIPVARMRREL